MGRDMIGIYKITNRINNHAYIGQSKNIEARWKQEIKNSRFETSNSYDYPLSRAFRKYGVDNFTFEVIEECLPEELNEKEKYYIQIYNTTVPYGYNQTLGGYSAVSVKLTLEQVEEITTLLKTTKMKYQDIGRIFGVSENMICGINTGYYWNRNIDYPIRTKEKIIKEKNLNRKVKNRPEPLILAQEIIASNFCQVGRKYGVSDNAIRKWCVTYGMPTKRKELELWLVNYKQEK